MTLDGKTFVPGDLVPPGVVEVIAPGRFASLQRLRYIEEVTPGQARSAVREANTPDEAPESEGDMCPECGGGPYKALSTHMTKMHKPQEE